MSAVRRRRRGIGQAAIAAHAPRRPRRRPSPVGPGTPFTCTMRPRSIGTRSSRHRPARLQRRRRTPAPASGWMSMKKKAGASGRLLARSGRAGCPAISATATSTVSPRPSDITTLAVGAPGRCRLASASRRSGQRGRGRSRGSAMPPRRQHAASQRAASANAADDERRRRGWSTARPRRRAPPAPAAQDRRGEHVARPRPMPRASATRSRNSARRPAPRGPGRAATARRPAPSAGRRPRPAAAAPGRCRAAGQPAARRRAAARAASGRPAPTTSPMATPSAARPAPATGRPEAPARRARRGTSAWRWCAVLPSS